MMEFDYGTAETNDAMLEISQLEEAFSSNAESGSSINIDMREPGNPGSNRVQVSASASSPLPSHGIARQTRLPNVPPPAPTNEIRPVRIPLAMPAPEPISRSVEENLQSAGEEEEQVTEKGRCKWTFPAPICSEPISRSVEKNLQPAGEEEEQVTEKGRCKWTFPVAKLDLFVSVLFFGCLIATLTVHVIKNYIIWGLELWKWCVLFMVIFSRTFNKLMVKFVVFVIENSSVCNEKVLYYVKALKESVQVLVWFSCVLLAWCLFFDNAVKGSKRITQILNYITMSLASLLIAAALWVVKTLLVEILASSFQVTRFLDRIQRSIADQHILEVFSVCTELMGQPERERVKRNTNIVKLMKQKGDEQVIGWLMKMKPGNLSAWTMKEFTKMITDSGLSSITKELEKFAREKDDKNTTDKLPQVNEVVDQIFKRLRKSGGGSVNRWELKEFFGNETELVLQRMNGAPGKQTVERSALKEWLVNTIIGRISLAESLNDSKRTIAELEKLVSGIVLPSSIIIWLLLMGILSTQVFVLILTQFFFLAFIFGNTAKTVFEGIIFVFVTHPFDKGDCCLVDGEEMIVEEINLLTTVFQKNGKDKILYPNSVLASLPIRNFYESTLDVQDYVALAIDLSTSPREIRDMEGNIEKYLESTPQHWHPSHSIVLKDIDPEKKMKMVLYVTHRNINFQNYGDMMSKRRSELVNELKKIFENLSINYHYIQPQDVSLKLSAMVY